MTSHIRSAKSLYFTSVGPSASETSCSATNTVKSRVASPNGTSEWTSCRRAPGSGEYDRVAQA